MRFLFSIALAGFLAAPLHAQQPVASVPFTSFNAVPRGPQVLLSWDPEKTDVQTYELEKSRNGIDFIAFGNVQGSTNLAEFLETDFQPFQGLSYYRLRIVATDGSTSFSNVVPVKYNDGGEPVSPIASDADYAAPASTAPSLLVVVRNANGDEFYSKVEVLNKSNPVECKDPDPALSSGTYTIVGCSDQQYYCKQLLVK